MKPLYRRLVNRLENHPIVAIVLSILLTLLLVLPLEINMGYAYRDFNQVISNDLRLQALIGNITYLDEALTMSARMNAVTGDTSWEKRYKQLEPNLVSAFKEMKQLAPDTYEAKTAAETEAANLKLVEIEAQSFDLVRQGRPDSAEMLLSGQNYESQKKIYAAGVNQNKAAIADRVHRNQTRFGQNLLTSTIISGISLMVLIPVWGMILQLLRRYLTDLNSTRRTLQLLNQELEDRVQHRTAELTQTMNNLQNMQLQVVQSEKMSALGNLVAGVAHEINNPVGCIIGNVGATQIYVNDLLGLVDLYTKKFPKPGAEIEDELESIDLDYLRQDLPKLIRAMKDSGDRIKLISHSLRSFSRADTDAKQLFDLHEGIDSTVLILRHRLKANHQRSEIQVVVDYGHIPKINCFPGQLNQVFMNILANAIDMFDEMAQIPRSDQGSEQAAAKPQQIMIRTKASDQMIQIHLRDNGKGIPENVQSQIFDHLFTTKGVGKGTGLGLSIARQIIEEKHGGSLVVNSQVGTGTEFIIQLPISDETREQD